MTYFVIAPNIQTFLRMIPSKLGDNVMTVYSTGKVMCRNGDRYIYVFGPRFLRGKHGIKIIEWAPAAWTDSEEGKREIQMAEME